MEGKLEKKKRESSERAMELQAKLNWNRDHPWGATQSTFKVKKKGAMGR